jgi:hypothetical protein
VTPHALLFLASSPQSKNINQLFIQIVESLLIEKVR